MVTGSSDGGVSTATSGGRRRWSGQEFWPRGGAPGVNSLGCPDPLYIDGLAPDRPAPCPNQLGGGGESWISTETPPQTDLGRRWSAGWTPTLQTDLEESPLLGVVGQGGPHVALGPWWSTSRV
jgi:hypothetical protein